MITLNYPNKYLSFTYVSVLVSIAVSHGYQILKPLDTFIDDIYNKRNGTNLRDMINWLVISFPNEFSLVKDSKDGK